MKEYTKKKTVQKVLGRTLCDYCGGEVDSRGCSLSYGWSYYDEIYEGFYLRKERDICKDCLHFFFIEVDKEFQTGSKQYQGRIYNDDHITQEQVEALVKKLVS